MFTWIVQWDSCFCLCIILYLIQYNRNLVIILNFLWDDIYFCQILFFVTYTYNVHIQKYSETHTHTEESHLVFFTFFFFFFNIILLLLLPILVQEGLDSAGFRRTCRQPTDNKGLNWRVIPHTRCTVSLVIELKNERKKIAKEKRGEDLISPSCFEEEINPLL